MHASDPGCRVLLTLTAGFAALAASALAAQSPADVLPSFAEPGISPDGAEIAFVSGSDIWTVPATGGAARLLVAHSAEESRPLYSPDGRRLAFNSDRDGSLDVYVMDLDTGAVERLTFGSGAEQLNGWSRDGQWVYFSSSDEDISSMNDVFRVRVGGGTPMVVAGDDYETEFFAAPGAEPGLLAISTRGNMARGQWWRNGHAHIDEAEIWLVHDGAPPRYTPLTVGGKNLWPMWSRSGDRVYFMSDRSGSENLWSVDAEAGRGSEQRLTDFAEGRVLWPSIAVERPVIAFERDFGIWTHDAETGRTAELDIRLMGSVEGPRPEVRRMTEDFEGLAISPDGEKAAFVARGEIFALPTEGEVPAARVTRTPAAESDPTWNPDSDRLAYVSWRDGTPRLWEHDFRSGTERRLTEMDGRHADPAYSPDGRWLAYTRDGTELRVVELASGRDRRLAGGTSGATSFAWSPDSRWLAFGGRTDEFTNAMVVPVEGGEARQVSFLANTSFGSLGWSATGDYLAFRTGQRTEPGRLVRVDLVRLTPTFVEDRFWDLFNQEPPPERRAGEDERSAAPSPLPQRPDEVAVDFDGIRRRGYLVDLDFSVGSVVLSPDGEHAAVTGDDGLHYVALGEDREVRRLSDESGGDVQFSPDGKRIWMLEDGAIRVIEVSSGNARPLTASAEVEIDFEREKTAVFEQGWAEMRDGFYDDRWHGADWDAVRRTFAPRVAGARTRAELSRLMNLMLGELNGSHLGHRLPGGGDPATPTGKLGLRFDRMTYERDGRLRVTEVIELAPAHVAGVEVGDYLLEANGVPLDGSTSLDRVLAGTPGEKVALRLADDANGSGARTLEVRPIGLGAERELIYRAWVEGRRAYVDSISGGRLGYVHIASMSEGALSQLIFDLDQGNHAREGVVVDVRNNNGGFVNVYAIDILSRRNYFTMENRGGVVAPSRVQLGQRALLAPTVLVTNQHTLSDGEDFTEGYRTLDLGEVVGEPTAGWIIYTGSSTLVDGSSVRMPRTKIRDSRGEVMELVPRPVDVEVERPAGESYTGRDSQLERAVQQLLERLGRPATTSGR